MPKVNMASDPEAFAVQLERSDGPLRLALGLDLGSNCGYSWSYYRPGEPFVLGQYPFALGQWNLSAGPYDSGAIRFVKLRQFLAILKPDIVFYELVRNTPPRDGITKFNIGAIMARAITSAELLASFRAIVVSWAEEHNVPCTGLDIGAIKKRATGKGNAGKPDMIRACNETFGSDLDAESFETTGADNVADSAFVLLLGLEQLGQGVEPIKKRPKVQ